MKRNDLDSVTISKAEYLGLLRFRDDMAWYWIRYRESENRKRFDYEGFMIYNQIEGYPEAKLARLAYWHQLKERKE